LKIGISAINSEFRNPPSQSLLPVMTKYFFDFRAGNALSLDDEGEQLPDVEAGHGEALGALADAIHDVVLQGQSDQHFSVEVRDDLGLVLEVTVVLGSKLLRKQ
jgi:hypothetical protein